MASPKLTIEQFASAIKQRDPSLQGVPDDVLVRKVLERRPEMISMLHTAEPRPSLMEHEGLQKVMELIKQRIGQAGQLAEATPWVAHTFRPGGMVDTYGRMITPGVKSVTPSPSDDPFYYQKIRKFLEEHGADLTPNRQFFVDRKIIPGKEEK